MDKELQKELEKAEGKIDEIIKKIDEMIEKNEDLDYDESDF